MMSMQNDKGAAQSRRIAMIAAGALTGAVAGYTGAHFVIGDGDSGGLGLDGSEIAALFVGGILLLMMAIVAIGYAIPSLGIAMKMYEDAEQRADEREMMTLSVIGGGAYALALALLALARPLEMTGSVPFLGAIIGLSVVFVFSSWRLLKVFDELWMGVNAESCTFALYGLVLVGGSWSALAHLQFVAGPTPLDWLTMLTIASYAGAIYSSWRRGMLDK